MSLFAVYARAANGTIGKDGTLPWHLPADLRHFKALTMGRPMIMGRRTFDSFGKPLPGRRHIVLTRDGNWSAEGAEVAHDVDRAVEMARSSAADVAVIGGAEIYRLLLPRCDEVYLTQIHADYEGDTVMPPLGPEWRKVEREDHPAEGEQPPYSFLRYERAA